MEKTVMEIRKKLRKLMVDYDAEIAALEAKGEQAKADQEKNIAAKMAELEASFKADGLDPKDPKYMVSQFSELSKTANEVVARIEKNMATEAQTAAGTLSAMAKGGSRSDMSKIKMAVPNPVKFLNPLTAPK